MTTRREREEAAAERDRAAAERDRAANQRDIDAAVRDRQDPDPAHDGVRQQAARDRMAAYQDRQAAADDRERAAQDAAAYRDADELRRLNRERPGRRRRRGNPNELERGPDHPD